jgi:iron-sulfur cluster assembly protein
MISVTEEAAKQVRRMMDEQKLDSATHGIRIGVVPSGCSGMSYKLDFESGSKDDDQIVEAHGIKVYLDPKSAPYLENVQVDWNGGLLGAGFKFNNPQAQRTCGCGESFSV